MPPRLSRKVPKGKDTGEGMKKSPHTHTVDPGVSGDGDRLGIGQGDDGTDNMGEIKHFLQVQNLRPLRGVGARVKKTR